MKKLGILACAALASLCTANLSAAVESDIVGYTTISMEAGKWYQVGYPFELLDGGELTVNNTFVNGFKNGDILLILNSETKTYESPLYWIESKNAWCDLPASLEFIANPSTRVLNPGQAVYINKQVTGEAVVSGRISLDVDTDGITQLAPLANFGEEDGNTWNQVTVIWPEAQSINEYTWDGLKNGDILMVLDSELKAYKDPVYWIESKNAWCDLPASLEFIAKPVSQTLNAGQAVYINKVSKGVGGVRMKKTAKIN